MKREEIVKLNKSNVSLGKVNIYNSGVITGDRMVYYQISIAYFIHFSDYQPNSKSLELIYTECIGGYSLQVTDTNNQLSCTCNRNVSAVLQCEDDQDSIIIEVCMLDSISVHFMSVSYSQVNGLHFLRARTKTYSSTIVLLVIVGVFSIQVSAVVPVLMCMLIVILIDSVSVVEKVRCVVT